MNKEKRDLWNQELFSGKRFIFWKDEILEHKGLMFISLILLFFSSFLDYLSGTYTTSNGGVKVPDLILDHLPVIDLSVIFVYFYILTISLLFLYPLFFRVKKFPIVLSQFSLLVAIRSFFIILTHLGDPVNSIYVSFPMIFSHLTFENDLFFSGHTAIPFLGFLLFKKEKIRYFFLFGSIILGITVLLMHKHYSIDVFSAFFITYGSYNLGNFFFKKFK